MATVWKAIPGYEGFYEASDAGAIRSVERVVNGGSGPRVFPGRILSQAIGGHKYAVVNLSKFGKVKQFTVHTLILLTFKGECPPGCEALHDDGNRLNNGVPNLNWDSRQRNTRDRIKHGTQVRGERTANARFSDLEVMEIKRLLRVGMRQTDIARAYGAPLETIHSIKTGKSWGHI